MHDRQNEAKKASETRVHRPRRGSWRTRCFWGEAKRAVSDSMRLKMLGKGDAAGPKQKKDERKDGGTMLDFPSTQGPQSHQPPRTQPKTRRREVETHLACASRHRFLIGSWTYRLTNLVNDVSPSPQTWIRSGSRAWRWGYQVRDSQACNRFESSARGKEGCGGRATDVVAVLTGPVEIPVHRVVDQIHMIFVPARASAT